MSSIAVEFLDLDDLRDFAMWMNLRVQRVYAVGVQETKATILVLDGQGLTIERDSMIKKLER